MNSSKKRPPQTLARLSAAKAQEFLVELANLLDDQSAVERFQKRFADMLPAMGKYIEREQEVSRGIPGLIKVVHVKKDRSLRILEVRDVLRTAWREPDLRTREYLIFLIQQRTLPEEYADSIRLISNLPTPSPFEEALIYLRRLGGQARYCSNPECAAPYFITKRKSQKYCSDACSKPSQREFKRQWWAEHGENWRTQRKRKKASSKGEKEHG